MATMSLLWNANFCWKPCTQQHLLINMTSNWQFNYWSIEKNLTHFPTLFTFAFLPSPMHPVMTHHSGLNTHKPSFTSKSIQEITFSNIELIEEVQEEASRTHLADVPRAGFSERRLTPEINLQENRGRVGRRVGRCQYKSDKWSSSCKPTWVLWLFHMVRGEVWSFRTDVD